MMLAFNSDIERALAINRNSIDARGNLKPFVVQYGEYALAKEMDPKSTMDYTPFVLSLNAGIFGVPELSGKPLVMTNSSLKHVKVKHGAQIDVLDGLVVGMLENLLVYGDPKDAGKLVFVLTSTSENGNRIISIVKANTTIDGVEVSQVRSVHGKRELEEEICKALDCGRAFYTNERTGDWLRNPRTLSAETAELSSETRQRLLEIHYTAYPAEAAGFVWREFSAMQVPDLLRARKSLADVGVDDAGRIEAQWRAYVRGTPFNDIRSALEAELKRPARRADAARLIATETSSREMRGNDIHI